MKSKFACTLLALLSWMVVPTHAADDAKTPPAEAAPAPAPAAATLKSDLGALVQKIQAKLTAGPVKEATLAEDLAAFDQLLVTYKAGSADELAMIYIYKAMLYLQVLEDADKAAAALQQLKKDFPNAKQISEVDEMLVAITKQQAAAKLQKRLQPGVLFPDFEEKDLEGQPVSVGKFKGNVVLVDFWATWCGPCVEEMPNVIALYKKYHARGFQVIGVSLDRDEAALKKYLADNKMTWPQVFDGKFWDSKLAGQYGVTGIPFTVLINGDGHIVEKNLRGPALEAALAKLLGP